ncbi:integrase core domain-containing protein [Desulfosporosinus metallidurans]|uniref:Mobile element protein n=1 Tax=Desulfosporosinus metallidurans TaxID=1888891 RepID=A0A1Q8QC44_9FIRM|nr:integrase core domain-containing protein [Desulfosporosinus metallidurans]OLN24908.1 Mobile element protein [Desulfosporosinus metallidurans]
MPWKKVDPMEERLRFISEFQESKCSLSAVCRQFGISRKTGYKWLHRFELGGLEALNEKSRAPHDCPHRTEAWLIDAVIVLRRQRPTWGPRKIAAKLLQQGMAPPAPSTIGDILSRAGLVEPRRTSRRVGIRSWRSGVTKPERANHVWSVDFKGWFRTRDGMPCHPLTVSDLHSRYLLSCTPLHSQRGEPTEQEFGKIFEEFDLPEIIRVDNGSPFGSTGPWGLSRLSVGWLKLGVRVEFIRPGHPEENGSHERMHRTMKSETTRPPEATLHKQAIRLEQWRQVYNEERPHEAIGQQVPASLYKPSTKKYAGSFKEFEYPQWYEPRRVRTDGTIFWKGRQRFIGEAFANSTVGLIENALGNIDVYLGELPLGVLDGKSVSGLISRGKRLNTLMDNLTR